MVAGRKIKHITNAKAVIFNKRLRNEKIIVQLSTNEFKKSVKLYTIDFHISVNLLLLQSNLL